MSHSTGSSQSRTCNQIPKPQASHGESQTAAIPATGCSTGVEPPNEEALVLVLLVTAYPPLQRELYAFNVEYKQISPGRAVEIYYPGKVHREGGISEFHPPTHTLLRLVAIQTRLNR